MTDIATGLYTWVQTQSAITALIGAGDACQFYPVAVQVGKTPPLVIWDEDAQAAETVQDQQPTLQNSIMHFTFIASDLPTCRILANAFNQVLQNFTGMMGAVQVQAVLSIKSAMPSYEWGEQQFAIDAEYKFSYTLS